MVDEQVALPDPWMPDGRYIPHVSELHLPERTYASPETMAEYAALRREIRRRRERIGPDEWFPRRTLCTCERAEVWLYADGTRRNTSDGGEHNCDRLPPPTLTADQLVVAAQIHAAMVKGDQSDSEKPAPQRPQQLARHVAADPDAGVVDLGE